MKAGVILALVSGLAVVACGDDEPADAVDPCAVAAEEVATCYIGTGSAIFEALTDGDDLEIHQGFQGGFHVFGSARVAGLNPGDFDDAGAEDNPTASFALVGSDGTTISRGFLVQRGLKVRTDGQIELVGEVVRLEIGNMDDAAWRDASFSVEIEDSCGTRVSDTVEVRLVPGN